MAPLRASHVLRAAVPALLAVFTVSLVQVTDAKPPQVRTIDGDRSTVSVVLPGPERAPATPNLTLTAFSGPTNVMPYVEIGDQISMTIKNTGSSIANSVWAGIYFSQDAVLDIADDPRLDGKFYAAIDPGDSTVFVPLSAAIPPEAIPGPAYLVAWIDIFEQVAESDESDNLLFLPITVGAVGDTVCVYNETFNLGDGGWSSIDVTEVTGVYWSRAFNPASIPGVDTTSQVWWCGTDSVEYLTPPGYGNYWDQGLGKSFFMPAGGGTLQVLMQWDLEENYDYCYLEASTDGGQSYQVLDTVTHISAGYEERTSLLPGGDLHVRFRVTSDGGWSDEDGNYDSNGAVRLAWVEVTPEGGAPFTDDFATGEHGWTPENLVVPLGGEFVLVEEPDCTGYAPCDSMPNGESPYFVWVAYDSTGLLPWPSRIALESPWIDIPQDGNQYLLEFDVYHILGQLCSVYDWEFRLPGDVEGVWRGENFLYHGQGSWKRHVGDLTPYIINEPVMPTQIKLRLVAMGLTEFGCFNGSPRDPAPFFDNVALKIAGTAQTPLDTRPGVRPFRVHQNRPNPMQGATAIAFDLGQGGKVRLTLHDVQGRLVRTLVNEHREADSYVEHWDGRDDRGRSVASGTYFYRLQVGDRGTAKTLIVLK